MDTRTKKTQRNILAGFLSFFVTTFASFIVRTIFIRQLTVDYLGIDALFSSILQLLSLGELGLSNVAMFTLYKPLANNETEKVYQLVSLYSKIYKYIALFIFIGGLLFMPFLKIIIVSDIPFHSMALFYILYLFNTCISYLGISKQILANADQKSFIIKHSNTFFNSVKSIIQILVLSITRNYSIYIIVQCVTTALQNFYLTRKINRYYGCYINSVSVVPISRSEKLDILKRTKDLAIYKLCVVLINSTDNIFVSLLLGTVVVGYYSNYALIFSATGTIFSIVITSIISSLGNLAAKETNEKKIRFFYQLLSIMQVSTSVIAVLLFLLANDIVYIWLGAEYVLPINSIVVLILNFYVANVINPVWMYREAMGLYSEVRNTMVVTALLNIVLTWILGSHMGLAGIFLATILSRIFTTVWYEPIILLRRQFKTKVFPYYFSQIKNLIITVFFAFALHFTYSIFFVDINIMTLVAKALLSVIILGSSYICINYKNEKIRELINAFLRRQKQ